MKTFSRGRLGRQAAAMCTLSMLLSGIHIAPAATASPSRPRTRDNIVLQWNEAALEGVRTSKLGPPMVARALAVAHTCMYDAWAAYDPVAVGTRLGGTLRRPAQERSLANKNRAISFAAYRAAVDLMPHGKTAIFDPLMERLGYDPADTSTDTRTATGIGNVACQAVLDFRHHDGSNQLGDEPGGTPGVAYSDYTGYTPANDPMDLNGEFDPATVRDPNRWQPLTYSVGGNVVTPSYVAPHWYRVRPFAMAFGSQFRSASGPAQYGSEEYVEQARRVVEVSANLTDRQKVIAEYWADGPSSEAPPGHWNLFAQFVSRRDHHGVTERGVDSDVKVFFALTNAIFDAGIVAWDNKRHFDSVRPITAVRHLFRGDKIMAWAGPGMGTQLIDGDDWLPYQPSFFPTPPFSEYSSGHSNFSAAGAEILRLATGSDRFGYSATVTAGSSKVEPGIAPANDVTLSWDTFSEAADEAGVSRLYGGIHFDQGNVDALATGRACAQAAWAKAQAYFNGDA